MISVLFSYLLPCLVSLYSIFFEYKNGSFNNKKEFNDQDFKLSLKYSFVPIVNIILAISGIISLTYVKIHKIKAKGL